MLLFFLNLFLNKFGSEKTKSVPHSPGLPYLRFLFFSIISIYLFYSGITEVILVPAVDKTSKKDLLARLSERHPNASYQKKEVSTGIPGFKFFCAMPC